VVVFARQFYTLRLEQIFKSILSSSHVKQLHREGNLVKHGYPIILLFMFSFSLALFMFQLLRELYPHSFYFSVGQGFLLVLGATVAYFIGKFLTIWYLGVLFQTKQDTYRYLTDQFLFQISASFVLLPLLILYIYSGYQFFVLVAIIVLSLLWIYRLQRAFVIGLACTNFSRSYLFLYLCTLEVLPLLILFKLGFQFV
ncbi:MAG: DUF4271 domain-containing protein, partial [Bacteroidales bacterium]|nr:DUF4271 domain-containing protein [Bacteroidales bacterium]